MKANKRDVRAVGRHRWRKRRFSSQERSDPARQNDEPTLESSWQMIGYTRKILNRNLQNLSWKNSRAGPHRDGPLGPSLCQFRRDFAAGVADTYDKNPLSNERLRPLVIKRM